VHGLDGYRAIVVEQLKQPRCEPLNGWR